MINKIYINYDRYIAMMMMTIIMFKSINMIFLKTFKRYIVKEFS